MPRTIESIMDAHDAATERRKAGRPIWDHTLSIKHLLSSDATDEDAPGIGLEVADILSDSAWLKEDLANADGEYYRSEVWGCKEEFEDIEDIGHFNGVLDHLYDLADADRVWID